MSAHIAILKTGVSEYWLMLQKTNDRLSILGFKTLEKGLSYFTDAYNHNHDRGYEASMSACINFIQFLPKVVSFKTMADCLSQLKSALESQNSCVISTISGSYTVGKLKPAEGKALYETGTTPGLISGELEESDGNPTNRNNCRCHSNTSRHTKSKSVTSRRSSARLLSRKQNQRGT